MPDSLQKDILASLVRDIYKWGRLVPTPKLRGLQKNNFNGNKNVTKVNNANLKLFITNERLKQTDLFFGKPLPIPPRPTLKTKLENQGDLLFERAMRSHNLNPGNVITLYKYKGYFYTQEECINKGIPAKSPGLTMDYISDYDYKREYERLMNLILSINSGEMTLAENNGEMTLAEYLERTVDVETGMMS